MKKLEELSGDLFKEKRFGLSHQLRDKLNEVIRFINGANIYHEPVCKCCGKVIDKQNELP